MKYSVMPELKVGQGGYVKKILPNCSIRRRLMDIGLVEETYVKCVLKSPGGDPIAYQVRGAVIAIRNEDAKNIIIKKEVI